MNPETNDAPRYVSCPNCAGQSIYATSNRYRPFCCARCQGIDFGNWASESFKVAASSPINDIDASPPQ